MDKSTLQIFPLGSYTKSDLFKFYERAEHRGFTRDMFDRWMRQVFGKNHRAKRLSAVDVRTFLLKKGAPRGYYLPKILE